MAKRRWREERQFGLSVGLVLLMIAAWLFWTAGSPIVLSTTAAVGAALAAFGLFYPRALLYPNRGWMKLAEALSFVSTRVVLGFAFFLLFTPLGLARRHLTDWDPLARRASRRRPSFWRPYSDRQRDTKHYEKMF